MKGRILLLSLSLVFLSGCVREESPLWYMTKTSSEVNSHFKDVCLSYGYKSNTPELNRCIREERQSSSSKSSARLYQAGQAMERAGTPMMYRNQNTGDKCRYNPAAGRSQICLRQGAFGCAAFGRSC